MFKKLECFYVIKQCAFQAQIAASACLLYLKKIYKKIYSKEYCLVEQSLCELETKEAKVAKMGSNPTAVETTNILGVESPVFKTH